MDFDGATTLFPAVEVYVQAQVRSWSLFPQPASELIRLRSEQPTESASEIRLLDLSGRVLSRQTLPAGSAEARFELGGLPQGIYLVELREQGRSQVLHFVKQ